MFKRLLASKHVQYRIRWIMGLLAATLIVPMVFFFHATGGSTGPGGSAGEMFGKKVPWEDFQAEYQTIYGYFQNQIGENVPLDMFEPMLQQQTWDRLLLREEARRSIRISDEDLAQVIRSQATFQLDGIFSQDLYYRFVQATGQSPQQFETRVRDDVRFERLLNSLKAQVSVTDDDVRTSYAKDYERMRAALLIFEAKEFQAQIEQLITDEDLRMYYTTRQESLRIPARRTLAYLGLSFTDALQAVAPPSDDAMAAYYQDRSETFTTPEGVVKPQTEVADDIRTLLREAAAKKRLTALALDLQEDLEADRSLEDIASARQVSLRTLGPLEAAASDLPDGLTSPMLDEAFTVELNHTTGLLNELTGVFILKPTSEIPSRVPMFEEAEADIRQRLVQERAREAAVARATQVHDELAALRQAGNTFEEAIALLGVQAIRPEPFTKQEPMAELPGAVNVPAALFRLNLGELSDALMTPNGAVIGLMEERLPFDEEKFAKERETYRTTVLERQQQEYLGDYLQTLRLKARLKSYLEKTPA